MKWGQFKAAIRKDTIRSVRTERFLVNCYIEIVYNNIFELFLLQSVEKRL